MDIRSIIEEVVKHNTGKSITETVYVSDIDKKSKKAKLTYNKGSNWSRGNKLLNDKLKTDKMDKLDDDTYEVPLKGGITSYNITSISGKEVMHYFKRHFDHEKTEIEVSGDKYALAMQDSEFTEFVDQFVTKVRKVIESACRDFIQSGDFKLNKISIYPVPSSSNFNIEMAKLMAHGNYLGYDTQVIDESLLKKDLRNIQRDTDFINKNSEFYSGSLSKGKQLQHPITSYIDKDINRSKVVNEVDRYVSEMNKYFDELIQLYYQYNVAISNGRSEDSIVQKMANAYTKYYDTKALCLKNAVYDDPTSDNGVTNITFGNLMQCIKYTKSASVKNRTESIIAAIRPLLYGKHCPIDGKPYIDKRYIVDINRWEPIKFQIKNLSNAERLGIKNIYNPNEDEELVRNELEKIKGTVFIIFDDNISGGATLSDVCYQCKQLGIEYIIPITFGKMSEKNTLGKITLNEPEKGYNMESRMITTHLLVNEDVIRKAIRDSINDVCLRRL